MCSHFFQLNVSFENCQVKSIFFFSLKVIQLFILTFYVQVMYGRMEEADSLIESLLQDKVFRFIVLIYSHAHF